NEGTSGAGIPPTNKRAANRVDKDNIGPSESAAQPLPITFSAPAEKTYGKHPIVNNATKTSGLPVSFTTTSANMSLELINDEWYVHILGAGSASITAHQNGDASYDAAGDVTRDLTINRANATIAVFGFSGNYDGVAHGVVSSSATG